MFRRHFSAVLVASAIVLPALFSAVTPTTAAADSINICPPGKAPQFVFGFADLSSRLTDWMGAPTTCEFPDPKGTGDVHQRTQNGLAFWRKSTNTPTFTNGSEHWALGNRGLVYWTGSSIDPPASAIAATGNTSGPAAKPQPPAPASSPRPLGPAFLGQSPDLCQATDPWGSVPVSICVYPNGAAAFFQTSTTGAWPLLGSVPTPASKATYTDAGRRVLGVPVIPAGGTLPRIGPNKNDTEQLCFTANKSCGRDAWWVEWNELQDTAYVQYAAVGDGFATERRFDEAVSLLSQWPEGKELLRSANRGHVAVVTGNPKGYASYRAAFSLITVSQQFTEVSTWMLADVLAHELRHAADDATGLWQANTPENCFGAEQSAYSTERRFLFWLRHTMHPEGLPNRYDLLAVVSPADRELALNLYEIGTTDSITGLVRRDYHETCQ
jgi:hypothetical protein